MSPFEDDGAVKFVPLQPSARLGDSPPEEFRARRDALRAACRDGIVVVRGAVEGDAPPPAPYSQSSSFFYLTGVETPGAYLVLLPEGLPASAGIRDMASDVRELLFLPARDPVGEVWTGAKLAPGAPAAEATGIQRVLDVAGLSAALAGWLRRRPRVHLIAPYGENACDTREYRLIQRIRRIAPVVQFTDLSPALAVLRVVKSAEEVERMRKAIAITAAGQRAARDLIAAGDGRWEYEVEAAVFETFRSRGASLAFASIIGGGPRGTVLHYEENRCRLAAGELVVVDIGAQLGHYCGDLTRTYPVGGKFTSRQSEIYTLVLEAQRHAVETFVPGRDSALTLRDRCKAFLRASPLRARDTSGVEHTMDAFMPHGLSHHLGLDVHDVGEPEQTLTPASVITVEPGIYIPAEGIGVRIEDDYLVTAAGLQLLGAPLEKEIDEIEAVMRPG